MFDREQAQCQLPRRLTLRSVALVCVPPDHVEPWHGALWPLTLTSLRTPKSITPFRLRKLSAKKWPLRSGCPARLHAGY